jgi:hypothetical protein
LSIYRAEHRKHFFPPHPDNKDANRKQRHCDVALGVFVTPQETKFFLRLAANVNPGSFAARFPIQRASEALPQNIDLQPC